MRNCPSCGSGNIYIHDQGWKFFLRYLTFHNRLVCRECRTTWKRSSPEKFAKLKRKSYRGRHRREKEYFKISPDQTTEMLNTEEISSYLSTLQEQKQLFICLDLELIKDLSHHNVQVLIKFFRRLQVLGGDLILSNVHPELREKLIVLNLGYLVATNQKIMG